MSHSLPGDQTVYSVNIFSPEALSWVPAVRYHSTSYYMKSEQLPRWTNGVVAGLFRGWIH